MAEERGLGRVGRWKRAGAMSRKELMPQEVEGSRTLGVAADLEGIVVIFSQVTGLVIVVKVVGSRQKIF
jgi:hypothetical protein